MNILTLQVGPFDTNCYILYDGGEGIIVDPGANGKLILKAVEDLGVRINLIVNTHGHFDHTGANDEVSKALGVPVAIHELDTDMLKNPSENLSALFSTPSATYSPTESLKEGDEVSFGKARGVVIHTPGHTKGSISIFFPREKTLVSGDLMFGNGSTGRTDLPTGSLSDMERSIKRIVEELPDDTMVFPGHEDSFVLSDFSGMALSIGRAGKI